MVAAEFNVNANSKRLIRSDSDRKHDISKAIEWGTRLRDYPVKVSGVCWSHRYRGSARLTWIIRGWCRTRNSVSGYIVASAVQEIHTYIGSNSPAVKNI
jgi:hypothetical protein